MTEIQERCTESASWSVEALWRLKNLQRKSSEKLINHPKDDIKFPNRNENVNWRSKCFDNVSSETRVNYSHEDIHITGKSTLFQNFL